MIQHVFRSGGTHRQPCGFSLIEVLIAASVLLISLVAIIAVIRSGTIITSSDLHRRQARAIISARMESPDYHYGSFLKHTGSIMTDSTIVLDERSGLKGTLKIEIIAPSATTLKATSIPVKKIIMTVSWKEYEAKPEDDLNQVTIQKWIPQ